MPADDPGANSASQQPVTKQAANHSSVPENHLREVREYELFSQTKLSALSGVSTATISEVENRRRQISRLTQNRLVHGFNTNSAKRDKNQVYILEDIFPNG